MQLNFSNKHPNFLISLLHLAASQGNFILIDELIKVGITPRHSDFFKFLLDHALRDYPREFSMPALNKWSEYYLKYSFKDDLYGISRTLDRHHVVEFPIDPRLLTPIAWLSALLALVMLYETFNAYNNPIQFLWAACFFICSITAIFLPGTQQVLEQQPHKIIRETLDQKSKPSEAGMFKEQVVVPEKEHKYSAPLHLHMHQAPLIK